MKTGNYCPNRMCMLVFAVCLLVLVGSGFSADWPNWRGPDYTGKSSEVNFNYDWSKDKPDIIWKISIGTGFSSMSVSDGQLFAMGNVDDVDIVYCLNADTGKEIWRHSYKEEKNPNNYEGGPSATPTVSGGKVYTISKTGKVFCLERADGSVAWQKDMKKDLGIKIPRWGLSGSVLVVDDMVILNAGNAGIALGKMDGSVVWQNGKDSAGYATAVPFEFNGIKYVTLFGSKEFACVEVRTGKLAWRYPWKTSWDVNAANPIIVDDTIFISSGYNKGCVLLKLTDSDPEKVWENKNMRNQVNSSVLIDGYLYGFDGQVGGKKGEIACIDFETGEKKWSKKGLGTGSLMAAGDKLIILGEKGKLVIAQAGPEGFKKLSSLQILKGKCWTVPVLANGKIYARNADGDLVCVDVSSKSSAVGTTQNSASDSNPFCPQFRGPNRDGKYTATGLLKKWPEGGPKMIWSVEGLGDGFSTVSLAHGLIYTTGKVGEDGIIFAVDLDGNIKWKKSYGKAWAGSHPGVRTTPTIDGDRAYVISGYGNVVCFDAKTGDKKWEVDTLARFNGKYNKWGISESVLIVDDKVICSPGGEDAMIVALDKMSGGTVWTSKGLSEKSCYCSPYLFERGGKKIVATMGDQSFIGIDADTGKVLWTDSFAECFGGVHKNINPVSPIYYNGEIFTTSGYNDGSAMYAVSADGTKLTRKRVEKVFDNHHGGVVLVDGHIYGSNWLNNRQGNWLCMNWDTGEIMYEKTWISKGATVYADGLLYCYEEKEGTLALVEPGPEDFKIISSFKIELGDGKHWAHPVLCDGRMYIRHGNVLMAYDVKAN